MLFVAELAYTMANHNWKTTKMLVIIKELQLSNDFSNVKLGSSESTIIEIIGT